MSGLAGIIQWDEKPIDTAHMGLMMRMIQHRGPDGLHWEVKDNIALGHALLALKKGEERQQQPVWLPDQSCAIVADARIYNRAELLRRLGEVSWFDDAPSDAALLLAAYEHWGVDCLDLLDGDFAFAIWDCNRDHLFVARDPFPTKPLFYHTKENRFLFASEPKQLLVLPDVPVEPDDLIVGEYLFGNFEETERSYFKNLHRLEPAHYLIATSQSVCKKRYWNPDPSNEIFYTNPEQYFEKFRELFKNAIAKRLDTDFPVIAQLSGGIDSSSIVSMAAEIYSNGYKFLPDFETLSTVFEDPSCDESEFIQAVLERVPFRSHTFLAPSVFLFEGFDDDLLKVDAPAVNIQLGRKKQASQIVKKVGARTLITGIGGDELLTESGCLADLAFKKRFLTLLRESWSFSKIFPETTFASLLNGALRHAIPLPLKRIYRSIRKQQAWVPPIWVNPEFVEYFTSLRKAPSLPQAGFNSLVQERSYQSLFHPRLIWGLESWECQSAYDGVEQRHPFLDRSLVEFILAIPFEYRFPPKGEWKNLARHGLSGYLPEIILNNITKTVFDSYVNNLLYTGKRELITEVFTPGCFESNRYILKEAALQLFKNYKPVPKTLWWDSARPIWAITTTEKWLRQIMRYNIYEPL